MVAEGFTRESASARKAMIFVLKRCWNMAELLDRRKLYVE
jgi:hypothetical protein